MPPLGVEGLESVTEHGLTQNHAVLELFGGDAAFWISRTLAVVARVLARLRIATEVGMALWTEPVESTAHVEFFLRCHIEQRQIEGGAAGVATL